MSSLYFVNIASNFCVSIFFSSAPGRAVFYLFFCQEMSKKSSSYFQRAKETGGQPNWKKQNYEEFLDDHVSMMLYIIQIFSL